MLVRCVCVADTYEEAVESVRPGHDEFWKFLGPYGWSRRDVGTFWKSRENPDAPFPIALAMGLDPAIMIAAGVKTHVDELFIAGAINLTRLIDYVIFLIKGTCPSIHVFNLNSSLFNRSFGSMRNHFIKVSMFVVKSWYRRKNYSTNFCNLLHQTQMS